MKKIHIIGGGTFSHVRNHLALAAPAFGATARNLVPLFHENGEHAVQLHLTRMADPNSALVTNDDVAALLDTLIADPDTRVIIMNAALCDYDATVFALDNWEASGKYASRLKTSEGDRQLLLTPADKLIGRIRKERKDIFLVAFKTTCGATPDEQYRAALNLVKANSANLVLANDTKTRNNMIVAPEETRYFETTDREEALRGLVQMVVARMDNTFTRSTVIGSEADTVPWNSKLVPDNLRTVVNHCIAQGAYKKFRGVTAGHFAVKIGDNEILTSKRKRDFNDLANVGLVRVEYDGFDKVIAHGAKPSVGGQSQRIVFDEHPDLDCIVHFHCPLKANPRDPINVAPQWQNECGSHQCGQNTSRNLRAPMGSIYAVMLDGHGPNIVFSRHVDAAEVIDFIEANFDLSAKTGGLVEPTKELAYA